MCDPVTLMTAAKVIGGVTSIIGGMQQAAWNRRQAALAEQQAAENAKRERERGRLLAGKQRVAFAKGGVVAEGTPTEVLSRTAEDTELNALDYIHRGDTQAASYRAQARSAMWSGISGGVGSFIGAAGVRSASGGLAPVERPSATYINGAYQGPRRLLTISSGSSGTMMPRIT